MTEKDPDWTRLHAATQELSRLLNGGQLTRERLRVLEQEADAAVEGSDYGEHREAFTQARYLLQELEAQGLELAPPDA
jgi:hypothetical protein